MKIKTISRSQTDKSRECKGDVVKVHRNVDPRLHPMAKAREYTRAIRSVKMDKIFAKPFIAALDGHSDGVYSTTVNSRSLVSFVSGACDGELRVWDLPSQKTLWSVPAHTGFVRGLSTTPDGSYLLSAGDDKMVKMWPLSTRPPVDEDGVIEPMSTWETKEQPNHLDHSPTDARFATCGSAVQVWDHDRAEPVHEFSWGDDSLTCVKWNLAEGHLLAATCMDRSILLYDVRAGTPVRKTILAMRSNKLAWNPREPMNFTVANEDHNAYTFDMRKLSSALMIHKDHVGAVLDVAYSPTGREIVTGSYDRTIRIFPLNSGRSREIYHTSRMQRVFTVNYTPDARFVLSGSDDTNVRLWKANASDFLGRKKDRERAKMDYMNKLKKKFSHMPEVRKIAKARPTPKPILNAKRRERIISDSVRKKADNVRRHAKPGTMGPGPERKRRVVAEEE